jgi:hypothetical protein
MRNPWLASEPDREPGRLSEGTHHCWKLAGTKLYFYSWRMLFLIINVLELELEQRSTGFWPSLIELTFEIDHVFNFVLF